MSYNITENFSNTKFSSELPIAAYKDAIIDKVLDNQVVIIHGETGTGKTTQIPKYLLEIGINGNKMIGVTEPRRIAAISMARRVAEETRCAIGKEVGYEIRFDNKSGASTRIKYMTDGILLNQCVSDRNLSDYSVIMVDEAHERSLRSDVLLGLLKSIVSVKSDIKIIITSATMDVKKFSEYFFDAPILYIAGSNYHVDIIYSFDYIEDYIEASVAKVRDIHLNSEKGDILVFLTGQEEIEKCVEKLDDFPGLLVLPLFGALEYHQQQKVFDPAEDDKRKAVISTNIAETSLTIEGIRFIVDCGYVKQSNFDPSLGIDVWNDVKISKAQADQRKGRAGRTTNGYCYRLYNQQSYNQFCNEEKPEIFRKNLSEIYLKVVAFGLDPKSFSFIDSPNPEALLKSERELKDLKLIDEFGNLTEEGKMLEDFPVEPIIGKIILTSIKNECVGEIVTILSLMTEKNIFKRPRAQASIADDRKERFLDSDGDPFTLLNVFNQWIKNGRSETWCRSNFLDYKILERVELVQEQLCFILKRRGKYQEPRLNINKEAIKRSILSGYFRNICRKRDNKSYKRLRDEERFYIFPGSSLFKTNPEYILYTEIKKTTKPYMHGVMKIDEAHLSDVPAINNY